MIKTTMNSFYTCLQCDLCLVRVCLTLFITYFNHVGRQLTTVRAPKYIKFWIPVLRAKQPTFQQ